jgi:hypothetical protein
MPVHAAMTAAMSSSVTCSPTIRSPVGGLGVLGLRDLPLERRNLGVVQPRRLRGCPRAARARPRRAWSRRVLRSPTRSAKRAHAPSAPAARRGGPARP